MGSLALGASQIARMHVVVVESPAKAKTINKYLGPDYHVVASYGHVRDLPAKDGSVKPEQDFEMDWEVEADSKRRNAPLVVSPETPAFRTSTSWPRSLSARSS